jgi:hypothetical protein
MLRKGVLIEPMRTRYPFRSVRLGKKILPSIVWVNSVAFARLADTGRDLMPSMLGQGSAESLIDFTGDVVQNLPPAYNSIVGTTRLTIAPTASPMSFVGARTQMVLDGMERLLEARRLFNTALADVDSLVNDPQGDRQLLGGSGVEMEEDSEGSEEEESD